MRFQALTTLLALVGALAAPAARAQQPPAGSTGFVAFTAQSTLNPPLDALMAINLNGVPAPFAPGTVTNTVAVNIPLNASGINLVTARSQHRRSMQAPREAELVPVVTNDGGPPVIFIPAEDQSGNGYVTSVDFRGSFPTTNTKPLMLSGNGVNPGFGVPYEILHPGTQPYVYYTTTDQYGFLVVVEVNCSMIGNPVVTSTYSFSGPPSRFATRITEISPGLIAVPWEGGVDIVSTPGLGTVFGVKVPSGFSVGTNVAKGWNGQNGYDLICGLQDIAPTTNSQHGWLAIDSTGVTASPVAIAQTTPFGLAPSGLPWRFAGGFYDIAITSAPGLPSTATFLLDDFGTVPFGTTANAQVVTVTQDAAFTTIAHTIAEGSPFGNPEVMANPQGSVAFMVSRASTLGPGPDFVGAIWPSVPGLTTAHKVVAMTGLVTPATVDRPLSLPGGTEFAVNASVSAPQGVEVFAVGLGTLASAAFVISASPASGLPNVMTGGLLGNLPIYLQGFTASDRVVAGFPLAVPPVSLTALPVPTPSAVLGGIVMVPQGPVARPATFGARQAMINFANGQPASPRFLYPVTSGGGSQIDVFSTGSTSGQWTHPLGLMLTSELYSF